MIRAATQFAVATVGHGSKAGPNARRLAACAGVLFAAAHTASIPPAFAQVPKAPGAAKSDAPRPATPKPESSKPESPKPAAIDRNGVLILVRGTLHALDHANKTGNYTVLRDLGSRGFQTNTAARLAEIFADHRKDAVDLGGIAVLEPQLTLLPQIEPNGMLRMAGFFPSVPMQVNFELLFQPADRQWKLFGLSVNVVPAGPQAPTTAPEPERSSSPEPPSPPSAQVARRPPPEQPPK